MLVTASKPLDFKAINFESGLQPHSAMGPASMPMTSPTVGSFHRPGVDRCGKSGAGMPKLMIGTYAAFNPGNFTRFQIYNTWIYSRASPKT